MTLLGLLALVDRGVQRELQTRLNAHGLSVAEYSCLRLLQVTPGLSNAELARRSLVTPQSMNEVVAKLQLRGLIERRNDPGHGRILRTQLSAAGRAQLDQAIPEVESLDAELRGNASDADVAQTTEHLMGVLDRLRMIQQHRP
ncbi:MAG: MarR family winged helix-turn-helix transcriptional regulator [Acidimicrobiales bacterium]